ncbi:hypothetical protein CC86DRAFT_397293 [Ophiobolus disseminans]|uniref:SRR1-like domain-containing protein n=1 Tax=Ophiobolus disseminans TaxID=1469910 RepID=A0A6A6ZNA6_9PLEO|nr:hypothetical protein CC86DRAFT_397293 [Ophiobolus disseminans]
MRGNARVKRQEVESEDGWTVITHGLSNVSIDSKSKKEVAGALPTRTVKDLTAAKLLVEFKRLQERWRDSAVATQIAELAQDKKWHVGEALCIGIGSFSRDWEHRWRSLWQLVLFVDIVWHLNKSDGSKVWMYAQDPAFTALDIAFLELLDVTAVQANIETRMTPQTFVYSPFVDWYILLPNFLGGYDPVLYVGNEILDDYTLYAQGEDKREKLEMCNNFGKAFLQGRQSIKITSFEEHAHALEGIRVYWKPTTTDQTTKDPPI